MSNQHTNNFHPDLFPLVSVVINTFNRCKLVGRAISSAINQSYKNLEIIVVDANSTDETKHTVENISDTRIKYFRSPTSDAAICLNTGFSLAKGEFIALLDDDDEWVASKIEKQVSFFLKLDSSYGWIGCGEEYWDDKLNCSKGVYLPYSQGDVHLKLLEGKGGGTAGSSLLMIRKSAIEDLGGFVEEVRFSTDFLFYLKLSTKYKFDSVKEVLCITHSNHIYQTSRGSIIKFTKPFIEDKIQYDEYILKEYSRTFEKQPGFRYIYYAKLARNYSYLKDVRKSFANLIKAISTRPGYALKNTRLFISIIYYMYFRKSVIGG